MPIFEFTCHACGHPFETLVLGNRQPVCPNCGSADLEKLYSTFAAGASAGTSSATSARPRFT